MSVFLLSSAAARVVTCFTTFSSTKTAATTARIASRNGPQVAALTTIAKNTFNSGNLNKRFMSTTDQLSEEEIKEIEAKIKVKGDEIRQLKADGIDKESLAPHVAELISLKSKVAPPEEPKKKKKANKKPQKKPQPKKETEMSESELRAARLQKAELMREAGAEPYEYSYNPTHAASELHSLYEGKLEGGEEDEEADVAVAGRIMAKRVFGKLAFFTLQDESSTIQLHLEKKRLGDTFKVCTTVRHWNN